MTAAKFCNLMFWYGKQLQRNAGLGIEPGFEYITGTVEGPRRTGESNADTVCKQPRQADRI